MAEEGPAPFERYIVDVLDDEAEALTRRWLHELAVRLEERPRRIFPEQTLLDDIPELVRRLTRSVLTGSDPTEDAFVERELARLGRLRRDQGYTAEELLLEFELLVDILFEAFLERASGWEKPVAPGRAMRLAHRLHRALQALGGKTSEILAQDSRTERLGRASLLSSFGRAVNHELRNRLNAARLTLDAYRASPEASSDLLDNLDTSLERLEEVSRDIFSVVLSHVRPSSVEGRREPLDELVTDVADEIEELARAQDVEVRVRGEIPDVQVDAARVQLALSNLLINAIKYSDPSKRERWVEIRCAKEPETGAWRVDVEDNGVGIPAELRQQVFEPAMRAENSTRIEGSGLGLGLAREAVSQMGGRIWVERSSPGEGTVFAFTLVEPAAA